MNKWVLNLISLFPGTVPISSQCVCCDKPRAYSKEHEVLFDSAAETKVALEMQYFVTPCNSYDGLFHTSRQQ